MDLYDDIGAPPESTANTAAVTVTSVIGGESPGTAGSGAEGVNTVGSNGVYHQSAGSLAPNQVGRRFQLYVGNLTWVSCNCNQNLYLYEKKFPFIIKLTFTVLCLTLNKQDKVNKD